MALSGQNRACANLDALYSGQMFLPSAVWRYIKCVVKFCLLMGDGYDQIGRGI